MQALCVLQKKSKKKNKKLKDGIVLKGKQFATEKSSNNWQQNKRTIFSQRQINFFCVLVVPLFKNPCTHVPSCQIFALSGTTLFSFSFIPPHRNNSQNIELSLTIFFVNFSLLIFYKYMHFSPDYFSAIIFYGKKENFFLIFTRVLEYFVYKIVQFFDENFKKTFQFFIKILDILTSFL